LDFETLDLQFRITNQAKHTTKTKSLKTTDEHRWTRIRKRGGVSIFDGKELSID